MGEPLLLLRNVSVGYDQWPVLAGLSFKVMPGQFTAIVGPNAAGKTTLFRGLFSHAGAWVQGEVLWNDVPVAHLRVRDIPRGAVAWVRQDRPLFPSLTVAEALSAALVIGDRQWQQSRIFGVYNRLPELNSLRSQQMRTLSGGQRAIVSLAVGLVNEPTLLCLDEPAANLDSVLLARVREVLLTYVRERNAGCLLIEHRDSFVHGLGETIRL